LSLRADNERRALNNERYPAPIVLGCRHWGTIANNSEEEANVTQTGTGDCSMLYSAR
jgi:hypothetical protein